MATPPGMTFLERVEGDLQRRREGASPLDANLYKVDSFGGLGFDG